MAAKPWHKVVELRPDLRSGELAMNMFAADLHEAFMRNGRHPNAQAAMKGVLDLADSKLSSADEKRLEDKFYKSFPFHPDLTDIFFSKWTQIRGYQKTRGALRTFALALREAEKWDQSPVISASVFLNAPDNAGISPLPGNWLLWRIMLMRMGHKLYGAAFWKRNWRLPEIFKAPCN